MLQIIIIIIKYVLIIGSFRFFFYVFVDITQSTFNLANMSNKSMADLAAKSRDCDDMPKQCIPIRRVMRWVQFDVNELNNFYHCRYFII